MSWLARHLGTFALMLCLCLFGGGLGSSSGTVACWIDPASIRCCSITPGLVGPLESSKCNICEGVWFWSFPASYRADSPSRHHILAQNGSFGNKKDVVLKKRKSPQAGVVFPQQCVTRPKEFECLDVWTHLFAGRYLGWITERDSKGLVQRAL